MSKRRLSGPKRSPRRPTQLKSDKAIRRFIGLSLSGGKSDRTCLAVVDYFTDQKRLFLTCLFDRVRSEEFISADLKIHEMILQFSEKCESVAFDVPLTLPKCVRCELSCPGYEACSEPEIKWFRTRYQKLEKRKPKKMFTPYTQRCVDWHMQELEDENLEVHHALGANLGPLTARARFIARRLTLPCVEVNVRLALWRLGRSLRLGGKSQLRSFRSSVSGEDSRKALLNAFVDRTGIFLYEQDRKHLIESHHAFDAFICAYIGFLKGQGQTEHRPSDFPRQESWVEIPAI